VFYRPQARVDRGECRAKPILRDPPIERRRIKQQTFDSTALDNARGDQFPKSKPYRIKRVVSVLALLHQNLQQAPNAPPVVRR